MLVNLAVNARDAMPSGGLLTISGSLEIAGEGNVHGLAAGEHIRLTIADTGTGMDAQTLARASEPFFTTKPLGQGTGLGLAMASGFAQQSGGALSIVSELGTGTTVTLWFPLAAAGGEADDNKGLATVAEWCQTRARVLLVDDEPLVRGVLAAHLEEAGYIVIPASDGLDALARLEAANRPDLLISDYAMPGMNGLDLVREARRRIPDLPVLMLTGYADPSLQSGLNSVPGKAALLLRKPVPFAELTSQARNLLESTPALAAEGKLHLHGPPDGAD